MILLVWSEFTSSFRNGFYSNFIKWTLMIRHDFFLLVGMCLNLLGAGRTKYNLTVCIWQIHFTCISYSCMYIAFNPPQPFKSYENCLLYLSIYTSKILNTRIVKKSPYAPNYHWISILNKSRLFYTHLYTL